MAGYHTKKFIKHDDYMTPKMAWENIKEYIPKDKVLWECFYGDGNSGQYLKDIGFIDDNIENVYKYILQISTITIDISLGLFNQYKTNYLLSDH